MRYFVYFLTLLAALVLSAMPWIVYGWLAMRETVDRFRVGRSTGTGTLPLVGAVAYCSNHKPVYQAMRKGQHGRPRHTARNRAVHLRATGWLSGSLCGCEPRYDDPILTDNPASVTCVLCQKAMGRHER